MITEPQRTTHAGYEPALETLLGIYGQRADLKARFPEAVDWDFRQLIGWAGRVVTGQEQDPAAEALYPHAQWYAANHFIDTSDAPWQDWRRCFQAAASGSPVLFETMQDNVRTAFNQHLTTLTLLVTEFELRTVLEIGTQYGHSTLALLEAARKVNGHVVSIDVEPCSEAAEKVHQSGLAPWWTFLQGNALDFVPPAIPAVLDLLFIDTFHLYTQTQRELNHFAPYLGPRSWIVLHDAVTFPGVSRAVAEFMEESGNQFRFYPFIHQHGLLLLRKS